MLYTSVITLHDDAQGDIRRIKDENPRAAAMIVALIRQIQSDRKIVDKLTTHKYGERGEDRFTVRKWLDLWKKGLDLWRLKGIDLERLGLKYRIIYLYRIAEGAFVILAVTPRGELDYDDPNHPIRQRVLATLKRDYNIK